MRKIIRNYLISFIIIGILLIVVNFIDNHILKKPQNNHEDNKIKLSNKD